ncbi:MAG: hypothetical protein ABIQ30_14950 [Devosia sp.]
MTWLKSQLSAAMWALADDDHRLSYVHLVEIHEQGRFDQMAVCATCLDQIRHC